MAIIGNPIITGGGGGKFFAAIQVNYPTGTTCTCSNEDKTITAPTTDGRYTFLIPKVALPSVWTVSCTDGTYSDSEIITINTEGDLFIVTLLLIDPILNNNSWDTISKVAQQGMGDTYWDIGDTKEIVLNGKIGDYLTLDNYVTYVFILDFNHPTNKTIPDNNIIFGGFKSLTGGITEPKVDVCLCDSKYGLGMHNREIAFSMNHYNDKYATDADGTVSTAHFTGGGWKACDLRYDILGAVETPPSDYLQGKYNSTGSTSAHPRSIGFDATRAAIINPKPNTLMAALPSDFRNVLQLHTHYTNNEGSGSRDNCFTAVVDAGIFLPTAWEITTNISQYSVNTYENNHVKRMTYYAIGNTQKKAKHNDTYTYCCYHFSSPEVDAQNYWVMASTSQYSSGEICLTFDNYSYGLAPAFKV